MSRPAETLASLRTPAGRGGIAVILLEGPAAPTIAAEIFRPAGRRRAGDRAGLAFGRLLDGEETIDEGVLAFDGERFEINIHGSSPAVRRTLSCLARLGATVVPAEQARPGFRTSHPRLCNPAIGAEMLDALRMARGALAVAALSNQWSAGLSMLASGRPRGDELRAAAGRLPLMRRLLEPAEVVIAGPANAGKSRLANALVGREVSLVHERAGTTRDWVRELALLDGVAVWLTDTAGLWEGGGEVEAESVRRARQCIARADLVLLLAEGAVPRRPEWMPAREIVTVATKADIARPAGATDATISAKTGTGLDALKRVVLDRLGLAGLDPREPAAFTARQEALLRRAADALDAGRADECALHLASLLGG
jgi:tRNA modification GTPase